MDLRTQANYIHNGETKTDQAWRFFLNTPTASLDAWSSRREWEALADPLRVVKPGEGITLLFDGSKLGVHEVAERTGRGAKTVNRALQDGTLHGHQAGPNGRWSVRVGVDDAWMRDATGDDQRIECGCRQPKVARRKIGPLR